MLPRSPRFGHQRMKPSRTSSLGISCCAEVCQFRLYLVNTNLMSWNRIRTGWNSRCCSKLYSLGCTLNLEFPLDTLLGALAKRKDVTDLTGVSNNAGNFDSGLGMLLGLAEYPIALM